MRRYAVGGGIVAAAAASPLLYLFVRASDAGVERSLRTVASARTLELLGRTTALMVAVAVACVVIAVPLAWLVSRTDLPGRRYWAVISTMPLIIPSYIGAYTIIAALGPTGMLRDLLGIERLPAIYGFTGAWLALTLFTYPVVLLTVRAGIASLDPALEEASRSLGKGRVETFRRVVLPQLRPSIAAGALIVALYALHDFGAVSLLRFDSFTRAIYLSYQGSLDRSRAAIFGLVLAAVALATVAAETRARRRVPARTRAPTGASTALIPLGRWRWPAFACCLALALFSLGLPVGVLLARAIRSQRASASLEPIVRAAGHTLQAGAMAAGVAVVAAWPVAMVAARARSRFAGIVESVSFTGYALPGLVVALSFTFLSLRVVPSLYQTTAMLIVAYVVLFLPLAVESDRASLALIPPALEDASRSLGVSAGVTHRRIVRPLARPGIVAGAALVFLTVMKELPATLLLAPLGFRTLATEVWGSASVGRFDQAAIPALILIAISTIPLVALTLRRAH